MNVSKYVAIFSFVFIQLISVGKVFANADEWMTTFRENIAQTWQQPEHYDLYIPAITWHARFAYDKEKTDRYNERPWGGGFGQSRTALCKEFSIPVANAPRELNTVSPSVSTSMGPQWAAVRTEYREDELAKPKTPERLDVLSS